ncbi:MAG TPA: uroporphyrinogen-III C-methyltransferase [Terriglobales bacterium]|nr:uroporphyrinogen-III C-methyltransferase [Terriglobales bacterium]
MKGKVHLVGAGPGDHDLLTLRAAGLLKTADVILHDDLVGQGILELASPKTLLQNVGKRCGKKKISQEEINFLMIEFASTGKNVVRLKGGDPLIFGRLGEEIKALREAGIEFEIVPGVTSAFGAAAAGEIPLTYRHVSSAVVFLTGQTADGNQEEDWQKFVSAQATLVIYMPGQDYSRTAKRLATAGAGPETLCAIVSRASWPDQQLFVTHLAALPRAPHFAAPTLLIVGDVVRFSTRFQSLTASMAIHPSISNLNPAQGPVA